MSKAIKRCAWAGDDPIYQKYHDEEWGVPLFDNQKLFELLVLEGMQAGLSWITILKKRENYRDLFHGFDAERIIKFKQADIDRLLKNEGIIRNKLKVNSIVTNSQCYLDMLDELGSFSDYIWQFVDGKPIINKRKSIKDVPAKTDISDRMSKELKKKGFKFVGSTICYAFMQAAGLVNDHEVDCCRYDSCNKIR